MPRPSPQWTVDLATGTVCHVPTGLSIRFEGVPGSSNFGGFPLKAGHMAHLDFLALVREGYRVYQEHYQQEQNQTSQAGGTRKPVTARQPPVIIKKPSRRLVSKPKMD